MELISRRRLTLATAAASLVLLAVPTLVSANPGSGPELVQRSGRLVVLHADRLDGTSTQEWTLVKGLSQVPVRAPADVWIDPGTPVRLEGTMRNGTLVLADSVTAVKRLGPSPLQADTPEIAAAPVMHDTAVILFGFTDGPDSSQLPTDASAADTLMFGNPASHSLNAYYREQTYDQIGFSGHVFGPYDIAAPTGTCSSDDLYTWAEQAEAAAGITDSAYQHYVFVFPQVDDCPFAGAAELGFTHVWINGAFSVPVIAHELGHNLGLSHAGGLKCTNASTALPLGTSCSTSGYEYKDPFDAMGQSDSGTGTVLRQMSMQHKLDLNLLPASAVQVVGASGEYHVAPMETLSGSVELLRVPKPGGGSYFVEYRWPMGFFDSQTPAFSGVYIRTESPDIVNGHVPPNGSDTALIDMHPTTGVGSAPWADARMAAGEIFNDALRGITIQSGVQDAGGATLAITMPLDTAPPSRPGRLSAAISGTTVALQWTAASDDFGVASYVVARDGAQVGTTGTVAFTDSGLAPGATVAYSVTAIDTAGNAGPAATVSVAIADTIAPSIPPNVTATVTRDGQVHLAWGASTDNLGVASYRVLRSGTGIAQANINAYVDKAPRPGNGATVTYSVVAFDLVGNASMPGSAKPLRAALLRKLGASHLKASRVKSGKRKLVRVKGTLSDVQARCRMRVGKGSWRACKPKANGAFDVSLPARGSTPVTLSLRDALGRVKLLTLRVR